jgi:Homing endonuclease associated repeat
MTREEIISTVQGLTASLGRAPRAPEFHKLTGIKIHDLRKHFGTFTRLLAASGLEPRGPGVSLAMDVLFLDWARVTQMLGKVPTKADYSLEGKHSVRPFTRRFGAWGNVPQGMKDYAHRHRLERDWQDVLKIIGEHLERAGTFPGTSGRSLRTARKGDRPVYGRPMFGNLSFAPTNEQGVLFVFGAVAHELGFFITKVQVEFPDVEALREVGPNLCQRTHWELEYESRNFLEHMHPVDGCDGIICWINNWPDCPLEVIELRSVVERLARSNPVIGRSGDRVIGKTQNPTADER